MFRNERRTQTQARRSGWLLNRIKHQSLSSQLRYSQGNAEAGLLKGFAVSMIKFPAATCLFRTDGTQTLTSQRLPVCASSSQPQLELAEAFLSSCRKTGSLKMEKSFTAATRNISRSTICRALLSSLMGNTHRKQSQKDPWTDFCEVHGANPELCIPLPRARH